MALLDLALHVLSRPLLRRVIGRWPQPQERAAFRAGVPGERLQLLQALARVEAARPALIDAAGAALGRGLEAVPRLAFMHLEKTAGSSVLWYLETLYGPRQVVPRPSGGDGDRDAVHAAITPAHRLLRGHFTLPFLRHAMPDACVVVVLREPRARILSCYYYWRAHRPSLDGGPGVNQAARAAARLPLLEFLRLDDADIRLAIDNLYVRRLTGQNPVAEFPPDTLPAALAALDRIDIVGVSEQLGDTLRAIARRLGVRPPAQVPRINVGQDNAAALPAEFRAVRREPLTAAIEAELDRLTRLDRIVYAAAVQRVRADRTAPPGGSGS